MNPESRPQNTYEKMFSVVLPQGPITEKNQGEFIQLTNGLQMKLALRRFADADADHFMGWRDRYSVRFRQVFDRIIKADPNYFSAFPTINDIPETVLEDMEKEVYDDHSIDPEAYEKRAA